MSQALFDPEGYESEVIGAIAATLYEKRRASAEWVLDAQGSFTQEEYDLITASIISGDQLEAGRIMAEAVARVLRSGCLDDARAEYARLCKEDEEDAARERAEA